ncbi:peptidoglycan-binding protein [Streptomyces sp. M19]
MEKALVAEGLLAKSLADGHFGTATVDAYAAWQRRCGYSGKSADGIPGKTTLTKLGSAHGFKVVD